jgi:hypothetical protein
MASESNLRVVGGGGFCIEGAGGGSGTESALLRSLGDIRDVFFDVGSIGGLTVSTSSGSE